MAIDLLRAIEALVEDAPVKFVRAIFRSSLISAEHIQYIGPWNIMYK